MTYTVEVDADGRIQLPDEVRAVMHLTTGSSLVLEQQRDEPQRLLLCSQFGEGHLVWRSGLPVIEGLEWASAEETIQAIQKSRAERASHVSGSQTRMEVAA